MKIAEIEARVMAILEAASDDEAAHGMEDALHQDVLRAIADGKCDDPAGCAKAALGTRRIEFARWCA
jgi:hypothetical protein